MGKKANPISVRTHYVGWRDANWCAKDSKTYAKYVLEDETIRNLSLKFFGRGVVSRVNVERSGKRLVVGIITPKVGMVTVTTPESPISMIEKFRALVSKTIKRDLEVLAVDLPRPEVDPQLVADEICKRLEARESYRKVIQTSIRIAIKSMGVHGVRVIIAGRIGGSSISRRERFQSGKVPLQTFSDKIFMAKGVADTVYGAIGIQVYVCYASQKKFF